MLLFINKHKNFINVFFFLFYKLCYTDGTNIMETYVVELLQTTEKSECTIEISEC